MIDCSTFRYYTNAKNSQQRIKPKLSDFSAAIIAVQVSYRVGLHSDLFGETSFVVAGFIPANGQNPHRGGQVSMKSLVRF